MPTTTNEDVEVRCPDCDAVLDPDPYYPGAFFPCLSKRCELDNPVTVTVEARL